MQQHHTAKITPCTAQVAGHTSDKTWPAKLRATWDTILAAEILIDLNAMLCPIKVNSNTIELTVHTSCDCVLDLLCVSLLEQ